MKNIYKICLCLAIFFATISIAWASLDYDSIRGYFLINSDVNVSGDNVVIGTKFNKLGALAVSHNLIFFNNTSKYTDISLRMMEGTINASSINLTAENFVLSSITGFEPLTVNGNMTVSGNLIVQNSGISFTDKIAPPRSIYVGTTNITTLNTTTDPYTIPKGTKIIENSTPSTPALTYDDDNKPYCQIVTWGNSDDWGNELRSENIKDNSTNSCDTNATIQYASMPSCCPQKYFVISATSTYGNADNLSAFKAGQGVMVCCRSTKETAY